MVEERRGWPWLGPPVARPPVAEAEPSGSTSGRCSASRAHRRWRSAASSWQGSFCDLQRDAPPSPKGPNGRRRGRYGICRMAFAVVRAARRQAHGHGPLGCCDTEGSAATEAMLGRRASAAWASMVGRKRARPPAMVRSAAATWRGQQPLMSAGTSRAGRQGRGPAP